MVSLRLVCFVVVENPELPLAGDDDQDEADQNQETPQVHHTDTDTSHVDSIPIDPTPPDSGRLDWIGCGVATHIHVIPINTQVDMMTCHP